MRIQREHLREVSRSLLALLTREGVSTIGDIVKLQGRQIQVAEGLPGIVETEMRAQCMGSASLTISYTHPDMGIPIEVKVRTPLYIMVIVKTEALIEGYESFTMDETGNVAQTKLLPLNWSEAVKELQKLSNY